MLDPYTAFGLVGNIIQLVDFGLKIISNAREISSTGLPAEYKNLEIIANNVTVLTKTLSTTQSGNLISGCLSEDEQALETLTDGCRSLATELMRLVELTNNSCKGHSIESFRRSLKFALKQTEIKALEKRLKDLRDELALHTSISTNVRQRDLFDSLKSLDQTGKLTFEAISQNNKLLKEFMEQNKSSAGEQATLIQTNCLQVSFQPLPCPPTSTHGQLTNPRKQPASVFRESFKSLGLRCPQYCSCRCHRRWWLSSPNLLTQMFGFMLIGYPSFLPDREGCTEKFCTRELKTPTRIIYHFPTWLVARYFCLDIMTHCNAPQFSLKFPQIVADNSDVFQFAKVGDTESIRSLFSKGLASPDAINASWGVALLNYAVQGHHTELCKYLLDSGADRSIRNKGLISAEDVAWTYFLNDTMPSATTRVEFQEIFSLYPGDSEWIEEQQYSTIHKILFGFIGRDLEEELKISTSTIDQPDAKGRTPLAWAAARADLHAIEVLLRYGADVNSCCSTGNSPIIRAVRAPSPVGIVPLLDAGVKFDWRTKQKFTALTVGAYYQDDADYLTPFLDRGADIEESDSYGMTPLACTAEYDHSKSAAVLLRYGANINTQCNDGWTPLLRAINSNSHRVLQLFLDSGADYLISSFKDETVLHFAARRGDLETMRLLSNADLKQLDIEAKTTKGHTAKELMEFRQERSSELVTAFENLLKKLDEGKFEEKRSLP